MSYNYDVQSPVTLILQVVKILISFLIFSELSSEPFVMQAVANASNMKGRLVEGNLRLRTFETLSVASN